MFSMALREAPLARTIPADSLVKEPAPALPLHVGTIGEALPDGGLPRGAVVELSAPYGLARATTIALAACASAQAEAKLRGGDNTPGAWCAWIESEPSLFAPAAARAGVDLDKLLVIHAPADAIGRVAVKTAASGVFSVIVIDASGVPGQRCAQRVDRWANPVRRIAAAIEDSGATVLLLTDGLAPRATPLPAAMRVELDRFGEHELMLRVAKERRGRVGPARYVDLEGRREASVTELKSAGGMSS